MPPHTRGQRPAPKDKGPQVLNDRIRAEELRLIDEDDTRIVSRQEAEELAEQRGLDLLIVSLDSSPPVVRLVDYGKYKFELEKKAREAKKKQHVIDVKEVKMGIRIDQHDYGVKLKRAMKFLEEGNKVKLTIRMRGRENQHAALAFDLGRRFVVDLEDYGAPEHQLRLEGRQLTVHLAPAKQLTKKEDAKKESAKKEDTKDSGSGPKADASKKPSQKADKAGKAVKPEVSKPPDSEESSSADSPVEETLVTEPDTAGTP